MALSVAAFPHDVAGTLDVFLMPGEFWFGDQGVTLRTTLGSCVAMTFWHPVRCIGGMCHYMLPSRGSRDPDGPPGRYGDEVMQMFLDQIRAAGTRPIEYEVKLFGAGHMFNNAFPTLDEGVPARNIAKAKELVLQHGLRVKAESLGGQGYRQVIFSIATGDVWVRQVVSSGLSAAV